MGASANRKVFILSAILLLPTVICWVIAWQIASAERTEFASGVDANGVVSEILEDRVRFNGRNSEEITEVRVTYTPAGATAAVTASTAVWSTAGLAPGTAVAVRYLPNDPQKILLRAGFRNRSSSVVFLTFFGGFWLVLDLAVTGLLVWALRRSGGRPR
jgi:hypothetical protein